MVPADSVRAGDVRQVTINCDVGEVRLPSKTTCTRP